MDLGLRIHLRGLQVALLHKQDKDYSHATINLDKLLAKATKREAWAVLSAAIHTNSVYAVTDVTRANKHLSKALKLLPNLRSQIDVGSLFAKDVHPEQLIWCNVNGITSPSELRSWLDLLESLHPQQKEYVFADEIAEEGCLLVVDRIWRQEDNKPREQQRWDVVLSEIVALSERANNMSLELLWACSIRAQVVVMAEYKNDLKESSAIAERALSKAPQDPRALFLIRECAGRQYLYAGQYDSAQLWLSEALRQDTGAFPELRVDAMVHMSKAVGQKNATKALEYANNAARLARDSPEVSELQEIISLCELGIAQWLADSVEAAFVSWDEAGERLFVCRDDTDGWKHLFVKYAHCTGYFSSLASTSKPPEQTGDGSPYPAPERGMFMRYNTQLIRHYNETVKSRPDYLTMANLASYAEAIGNDERAAEWALRGIDAARDGGFLQPIAALSPQAITPLLLDDRYAEALDVAIQASEIAKAGSIALQTGSSVLRPDFDVELILGSKPNKLWRETEQDAIIIGALPALLRLASVAIGDITRGQRLGLDFAKTCRQISNQAADKFLWETSAELFERIFAFDSTCNDLIDHSNAFDREEYSVLRVIGYLGAILQDDAIPKEAFRVQLVAMDYLRGLFSSSPGLYRRIFTPFVVDYWNAKFPRMRFRFSSPQMVSKLLSEASDARKEEQAQLVLRAIDMGLSVTLPAGIRDLLHKDGFRY